MLSLATTVMLPPLFLLTCTSKSSASGSPDGIVQATTIFSGPASMPGSSFGFVGAEGFTLGVCRCGKIHVGWLQPSSIIVRVTVVISTVVPCSCCKGSSASSSGTCSACCSTDSTDCAAASGTSSTLLPTSLPPDEKVNTHGFWAALTWSFRVSHVVSLSSPAPWNGGFRLRAFLPGRELHDCQVFRASEACAALAHLENHHGRCDTGQAIHIGVALRGQLVPSPSRFLVVLCSCC
jgi:hypothetical protein